MALVDLVEKHKLMRRIALVWTLLTVGFVLERVTRPEVIVLIEGPGASIALGVIGMLSTIIMFYMNGRQLETAEQSLVEPVVNKFVSTGKRIMPKRKRNKYHDNLNIDEGVD